MRRELFQFRVICLRSRLDLLVNLRIRLRSFVVSTVYLKALACTVCTRAWRHMPVNHAASVPRAWDGAVNW